MSAKADRDPSSPATVGDLNGHEQREDLSLEALPSKVANRIFRREALLTLGVLGLGALGALGARAWAQTALDAGAAKAVAPVEARVTQTEARLDKIEPTLQQIALEQVRVSTGVDMLLRERGLVPPPKVLPDGGP